MVRRLVVLVGPSWASGSGSSGARSTPSTSAIWWRRSTPSDALRLDRVILVVANVPGRRPASGPSARPRTGWPWSKRRWATCRGWRPAGWRSTGAGSPTPPTRWPSCTSASPDDELFLIVGLGRGRRADDVGAPRGDPAAGHPGGGQPARCRAARTASTTRAGGWWRSPSRTWRSRAPTCGPGPPTAARSTTWSPRRLSAASGPGVCTLEADDDGPLGPPGGCCRCTRTAAVRVSGCAGSSAPASVLREELLAVAILFSLWRPPWRCSGCSGWTADQCGHARRGQRAVPAHISGGPT